MDSHMPDLGSLPWACRKKLRACPVLFFPGQLGAIMVSKCIEGYVREGGRDLFSVEISKSVEVKVVKNRLMWEACLPSGPCGIQSLAVARGHACVFSPVASRVFSDAHGSCYC